MSWSVWRTSARALSMTSPTWGSAKKKCETQMNQQIPVSFTFPCSPSAVWLDWPPGRYSTSASSSRPRSLLSRHPSAFLGRWHKSDHKWPKTGHHVGCPWKWYYVYQLKSTNHKGKKMNILFLFIYKYFSHQLHLK